MSQNQYAHIKQVKQVLGSKYKFWAKGQKSADCKPACIRHTDVFLVVISLPSIVRCCYNYFATQLWSLSAVKKDVIACSSVSLEDGQNIPKQSDIKKSSVKTYDKRQDSVGLYFWKGLTIRYSLCKVQLPGVSGKRRKRVFFFFLWRDVWNKFML